jgi:hypothetical protein
MTASSRAGTCDREQGPDAYGGSPPARRYRVYPTAGRGYRMRHLEPGARKHDSTIPIPSRVVVTGGSAG